MACRIDAHALHLFFNILMVFESSPFETFLTSDGVRDGKGLNALQNPTMASPASLLTATSRSRFLLRLRWLR